jgi:hypothetical protein
MSKDYSFQNLRGANFQGADLYCANFMYADVQGAFLQRADIRDAKLQRSNFANANLKSVDAQGANLRRANFCGANLEEAKFAFAKLEGADFRGANLRNASFTRAKLEGALLDYQIEKGLLLKVAHAALQDGALEMGNWHTCDTKHCIAGWAEVLSEKTRKLAETHGIGVSALLTLGAEAHKYFWASNEDARKFLQSVVAANDERLAETVSLVLLSNN